VLAGAVLAGLALVTGARRETRSRYRRDPWALPEWLVVLTGLLPAAVLVVATQQAWPGITPVQVPAALPAVPLPAVLAIACAGLAGVLTPVPPQRAALQAARPPSADTTGRAGSSTAAGTDAPADTAADSGSAS
jgi:energy-coupling factor transport system permease protein